MKTNSEKRSRRLRAGSTTAAIIAAEALHVALVAAAAATVALGLGVV